MRVSVDVIIESCTESLLRDNILVDLVAAHFDTFGNRSNLLVHSFQTRRYQDLLYQILEDTFLALFLDILDDSYFSFGSLLMIPSLLLGINFAVILFGPLNFWEFPDLVLDCFLGSVLATYRQSITPSFDAFQKLFLLFVLFFGNLLVTFDFFFEYLLDSPVGFRII